jgi:hypothetical protein
MEDGGSDENQLAINIIMASQVGRDRIRPGDYQALLFTNIAVAPEQSQQFSLFDPAVGSTQYGNAPFHGFSFGATVAY